MLTVLLYMYDGSIVYDEATAVGEVPERVQKAVNALRKSNDDEKLANVSAMIETMPEPPHAKNNYKKESTRNPPNKPRKSKKITERD